MKQRVFLWDNLKVICMMLVVMTHAVCPYQKEGGLLLQSYWVFIMTFTMPMFCLISGYWFKQQTWRHIVNRLFFPFCLFSLIIVNWGGVFYEPYIEGVKLGTTAYAMYYLLALSIWYVITPYLLLHIKLGRLFPLSIGIAIIFGVIPHTDLFNMSRIVCFYPFFLMGLCLRHYYNDIVYTISPNLQRVATICFALLCIVYLLANSFHPGIVYSTGFVSGFGLSISGVLIRVFTIFMCMAMCLALIAMVPNKEYWFTKYGSRTMNVYLLHMLIVFPVCWWLTVSIRDTWYGIVINAVCVPFICMLLFSAKIDRLMKKLLCQN